MSSPAKRMLPALGRNWPINWLISVVLPAPFGPMTACSSPRPTSSERLSVAMIPPKRRTRFSTRSNGSLECSTTSEPPDQAQNAAAPEQHDQEQERAHDERPVFGELR